MGKRLIGSVGLKPGTDTGFDLDEKGQIHGYSDTQFALPVGDDNQVLTSLASEASGLKWANSAGNVNLTFIAEVNLGSANAVIEKNSGLDDYECVVVDFVLREAAGDTFVPVITIYEDGAEITANYGFSETIDGGAISKTNTATEIPVDANTTGNNNCAGRVTIFPHTDSANILSCAYTILAGTTTSAPDAFCTVWGQHDGGSNRVSGIKFEQTGGGTPTFSDESHLEIWGIKEI